MTAGALTKIGGLEPQCGVKCCVFQYLFSTAYASGGEVVDFSSYFRKIYAMILSGSDTAADLVFNFQPVLPASVDTAITASNVKFAVYGKGGDISAENDTANISSIGQLGVVAYGI
jgi:hypothetical protein